MKKFWRNKLVATTFILVVVSTLQAQQKNSFTVKQCVDYAINNSVQVKNALLDVKIQDQTNKEITAIAYPQVNGSISLNDFLEIPTSLVPAQFFGGSAGTFAAVKFGTKYNATGGIDVSQILFDGQVFVGLQARNTLLKFSNKNVQVTEEGIKANIYKIYYQLVVGNSQLTSLDANIERFQKLLHDVTQIYKNGFAEKLDVDKVTVQLTNLETEKQKVMNALQAGNTALKFLMAMPQKDELLLTDTLSDEKLKKGVIDEVFNYGDRKEIQLLDIAKKLSEYNIKRYKLSYLPSLVAFASYSKNAQRSKFNFLGKGDWFGTSVIGLKLQAPIFDGFAKRSRIHKAKFELEKINNNIDQFKQLIDNDVEQAKLKMKTGLLTMDVQKKNIDLAVKVYNTAKLKYEQGLGSNQEIYNAQADLKTAQTNYYAALYDAITAKIDWLKAVGKL